MTTNQTSNIKTALFKSKAPNYSHPLITKRAEINEYLFTGSFKKEDFSKILEDENIELEIAKKLTNE